MLETKEEPPTQELPIQELPRPALLQDNLPATVKKRLRADGPSGYTHRVFISHRGSQKVEVAFPIMAIFSYFCWPEFAAFDEVTLAQGDDNREVISEALSQSRHCLVLVSEDFFESKWTIGEVEAFFRAQDGALQERKLIPLFIGLSPGACGSLDMRAYCDKEKNPLSSEELKNRQALAKKLANLSGRERADGTLGKKSVAREQVNGESERDFILKQMPDLMKNELRGRRSALLPEFDDRVDPVLLAYVYDGAVRYYEAMKGKVNADNLQTLIRDLKEHAPKAYKEPAHFHPGLPPFVNDLFVERKALIQQINALFHDDREEKEEEKNTTGVLTAVHGLGGIGKTQLALYYYERSLKAYAFKCWFRAEQIDLDYREFCRRFHIPLDDNPATEEIIRRVTAWMERKPGSLLLVYDNVTDAKTIRPYLPKNIKADILLTSRFTQRWRQINVKELPVGLLSEDEAIELVKRALSNSEDEMRQAFNPEEETSLKELVKEVGYLPLALAQAAAYIKCKHGSVSITEYLEFYRAEPDMMLDEHQLDDSVYPQSVRKTWLITVREIAKQPDALEIFKLCVYLAPDGIPHEMLLRLVQELKFPGEAVTQKITISTKMVLAKIIELLTDFSMVNYRKEINQMSIHRLVQDVIRYEEAQQLTKEELFTQRIAPLAGILKALYPDFDYKTLTEIEQSRRLLPHLEKVLQALTPWVNIDSEHQTKAVTLQVNLLLAQSNVLMELGKYSAAKPLCEKALTASRTTLGESCAETGQALLNLGDVTYYLGEYQDAKKHFDESLLLRENLYGETHPDVATSCDSLGIFYDAILGDAQEALEYHKKALKIRQQVYSDTHQVVATSYNNLGSAYESLGDTREALKFHKKALAIRRKVYGDVHPDVAVSYSNLGNVCYPLEGAQKALECHEKALTIRRQIYGDVHPDVATSYNNAGNIHNVLGNTQTAVNYHTKALEISRQVYGEVHSVVVTNYSNLGSAYDRLGEPQKALECLNQASVIQLQICGETHPHVARNIGSLYQYKLNQPEAAREHLTKALMIYRNLNEQKMIADVEKQLAELPTSEQQQFETAIALSLASFEKEQQLDITVSAKAIEEKDAIEESSDEEQALDRALTLSLQPELSDDRETVPTNPSGITPSSSGVFSTSARAAKKRKRELSPESLDEEARELTAAIALSLSPNAGDE